MAVSVELKEKGIDVVIDFVAALGSRNFDTVRSLLSDNSLVQTYKGLIIQGNQAVMDYWKNKFTNDPNYIIEIDGATVKDKKILLIGAEGLDNSEEDNAVWEVSVENGKITYWREYFKSHK